MDWNHINTLLSVIHSAAAAGPKFAGIASLATEELMNYMTSAPVETDEEETDE